MNCQEALLMINAKASAVTENTPEVIDVIAEFYDSLDAKQQAMVKTFMAERMQPQGHHRFSH